MVNIQEIINDGALNGIKPEKATTNRKNVVFATFFAVINQILSMVCILATSPIVFVAFLAFFFLPPTAVIMLGIWFNFVEVNLFLFLFVFRRKKFPKKEKVTALPMAENQEAEQIL